MTKNIIHAKPYIILYIKYGMKLFINSQMLMLAPKVWEWLSKFIWLYDTGNYLSMLGLNLNHVNKEAPEIHASWL